jgi:FkbM family methyltransferase
MTNYDSVYTNDRVTKEIEKLGTPRVIVELGTREGYDSMQLAKRYPDSKIMTFEANPAQHEVCLNNLTGLTNVRFFPFAAGAREEILDFHEYTQNNVGASSLFKRTDYDSCMRTVNKSICKRLDSVLEENEVTSVDYLCADIQGYEIEAMIGMGRYLQDCKHVLIEVPISETVYVGAPNNEKVMRFMHENNFDLILIEHENLNECNCLFRNRKFSVAN